MNRASLVTSSQTSGEIRLVNLTKTFDATTAVDHINLTIPHGSYCCLLGPSGCGKTTILRMIAGHETPTSGEIYIGKEMVVGKPPVARGTAMMFQSYALFPHLTVLDNVAFYLKMRKVGKDERRQRAQEMLHRVQLQALKDRMPAQLSGGQQQRVALARSLITNPRVLLLDEPLSALDAKVRSRLRDEIRRVQIEAGVTTLFVTHDQEEALAIADRVGVMRAGRLEQLGSPTEIYSRPATPFVAEFVGLTNRLAGVVKDGEIEVRGTRLPLVQPGTANGPAVALVRPEAVSLAAQNDAATGPLSGTVIAVSFLGATSRVTVDLGDVTVLAQLPTAAAAAHTAGTRVQLALRADPVLIAREETAPPETI
jgi:putative spermidine/putrescine transport system ATP-binding protein